MKNTPFTALHIALGAKMHEFAGYNMPIEYTGIIDEHLTVLGGVGVFDVSHIVDRDVGRRYSVSGRFAAARREEGRRHKQRGGKGIKAAKFRAIRRRIRCRRIILYNAFII